MQNTPSKMQLSLQNIYDSTTIPTPPITPSTHFKLESTTPTTCVFSDLLDSTELWELGEDVMSTSLALYYHIMRSHIPTFNGYEVKNLGDGMFITFPNSIHALQYCIAVQQDIASTHWPQAILDFRARKDRQAPKSGRSKDIRAIADTKRGEERGEERTLYTPKGLTTRMGMHFGVPHDSSQDPTSSRVDFHGNMVNIAARVMGQAQGDEIAMTDATLCEIQKALNVGEAKADGSYALDRVMVVKKFMEVIGESGFQITQAGHTKLKGVANLQFVTTVRLRRTGSR